MKHRKGLFPALILVCLLIAPAALSAQTLLSSQNHNYNPALFAFSPRSRFEIGLDTQVTGYNTALALPDVFSETLVIDSEQVIDTIDSTGLRLGSDVEAGGHITAHAFGFGLGAYGRSETIGEFTIPTEFFELIAEGNLEDRSGSGGAALQSFAEAGAYVSGRYRDYTIGVKAARFIPVAYSKDAEFNFEFNTTDSGFNGEAGVDMPLFSAVDLEALVDDDGGEESDAEPGSASGGLKVDLGVIRRDADDRPWWGASINDLSIVPASGLSEFRATGGAKFDSEDALQSLIDGEDGDLVDAEIEDLTVELVGDSDEQVGMPLSVSGFYRFDFPWVDVTPHAEAVFHSEVGGLNPGVTVSGNRFPTNLFYAGAERSRLAWRAGAGVRVPLYVAELGLHLQSASRTIGGLFGPQGLSADLNLRIGF
ncbi:MAG: hypothetical protein ACLFM0_09595 [Spirochaetales bacterium]